MSATHDLENHCLMRHLLRQTRERSKRCDTFIEQGVYGHVLAGGGEDALLAILHGHDNYLRKNMTLSRCRRSPYQGDDVLKGLNDGLSLLLV